MAADRMAGERPRGVGPDEFRRAMAQLAGGVVVVTTADHDGRPSGVTATAVCSVSLEPPLVLVCLGTGSRTRDRIAEAGRYAINILGASDRHHSERFSSTGDGKFDGVAWDPGTSGCPILEGSLAVCECDVEQAIEAGDHTIFIGRVIGAGVSEGELDQPLVWVRGSYGRLAEDDVS